MSDIKATSPTTERILVCFDEKSSAQAVIRCAARIATDLRAELYALYVEVPGISTRHALETTAQLARNQRLAGDLGAQIVTLHSYCVTTAILTFARQHSVSQIILGQPRRTWWRPLLVEDIVTRIRERSDGISVHVVARQ